MASEPTLDIEQLTGPISDEAPSGTYLKQTDYDRLQTAKDLRAKAVGAERKERELMLYSEEDLEMIPDQDRYVEPPDWRAVRDSCVEILANHSKDLWVASWLVEANTRLHGFAGMRDSFRVIDGIVNSYWSAIHPPPDEEEGHLGTVSQLTSLNGEEGPGTLLMPIDETVVLPNDSQLTFAAYRQATEGSGGDLTEGDFLAAAQRCDTDQLRSHGEDMQEAVDAYASMISSLEEVCGEFDGTPVAPPSSQIRNALSDCLRIFQLVTRDVLASGDPQDEAHDEESGELTVEGAPAAIANNQVTSREDAFRLLLRASEFFRKTEPHSPVSYMLQQAVKFGRMELPDLLRELINDEDVLTRFAERTGIEIPADSENEYD